MSENNGIATFHFNVMSFIGETEEIEIQLVDF